MTKLSGTILNGRRPARRAEYREVRSSAAGTARIQAQRMLSELIDVNDLSISERWQSG